MLLEFSSPWSARYCDVISHAPTSLPTLKIRCGSCARSSWLLLRANIRPPHRYLVASPQRELWRATGAGMGLLAFPCPREPASLVCFGKVLRILGGVAIQRKPRSERAFGLVRDGACGHRSPALPPYV